MTQYTILKVTGASAAQTMNTQNGLLPFRQRTYQAGADSFAAASWGPDAELELQPGDYITATVRMTNRDSADGTNHFTSIIVRDIHLLARPAE